MPWTFVGVSSVVEVTATTHTLTLPASTQDGDLLVAVISSRIASTTSITLPSGWTLVAESKTNNVLAAQTTSEASGMMAYIVRGASAPALGFTHPTAPSVARGQIVAYRGQKTTSPFDVGIGAKTSTAITAVSTTGLTTAEAEELIVKGFCSGRAATSTTHNATNPGTSSGSNSGQTAAPITGTWQERSDASSTTGADTGLAIADAVKSAAGATGNFTCTASVSGGHAQVAGAFKMQPPTGTLASTETADAASFTGEIVVNYPVQTGSTLTFNPASTNSGTVSSTITVPSDAQLVIVGFSGYSNATSNFFSSGQVTFTKGGVDTAMTVGAVIDTTTGRWGAAGGWYMALPDTGSNKSLKWDWVGTGAPVEELLCSVTFWKNVDTSSPVRSTPGALGGIAPSVSANAGDVVVAWMPMATNTTSIEANLLGVTTPLEDSTIENLTHNVRADGAWVRSNEISTGNTWTDVGWDNVDANFGDAHICLFVLKPPSITDITGTLGVTDAKDTLAATGSVYWDATLQPTEGKDTLLFNGSVYWAAPLAVTEGKDVFAATGSVYWAAPLAATEARDTLAITGSVFWDAQLAASEAPDVASFAGAVLIVVDGTLAVTEAPDSASFTGTVEWLAALAASEAPDIAAFVGEIFDALTGTLTALEGADEAVFGGEVAWVGQLVSTEASDFASLAGSVRWDIVMAASEEPDVAEFEGIIINPITGTLAVTEGADSALFEGAAAYSGYSQVVVIA